MTSRNRFDSSSLAALLAASLGAAALAGCSHRASPPESGAAPAPAESSATTASDGAPRGDSSATAARAPSDTAPAPSEMAPGPTGTAPAAAPAPAAADTQLLKWDPTTKTVTFRLVAGPFDFNGYTNGGATLSVPPASQNVINFEQNDGTPHSAEIDSGGGPLPNSGGNPAIPRAYTNKVVEGLPQGAKDNMRFTAPESGTYRIICGVPGHALSGMWIWYKVDPAAAAPSFGPTKK
jgi:plastocyanin